MAKFCNMIGFGKTEETQPDVCKEVIKERSYRGDILQASRRWDQRDKVNDDLNISNRISIVGDPFMYENYGFIKYVKLMGVKWKVTNVEIKYPRLILTVGGVYNEAES